MYVLDSTIDAADDPSPGNSLIKTQMNRSRPNGLAGNDRTPRQGDGIEYTWSLERPAEAVV